MPYCAVATCKNRSETANYKLKGISYHRFPKDPKYKEKWINATNRKPDWWPNQRSTICSIHFEDSCFQALDQRRRLFNCAVPTLKLKLVYEESTSNKDKEDTVLNIKEETPDGTPEKCKVHPQIADDTLRLRKMRLQIERQKNAIIMKNKQIRTLQQKVRRCKKKIAHFEEVFKELRNNKILSTDQIERLENIV